MLIKRRSVINSNSVYIVLIRIAGMFLCAYASLSYQGEGLLLLKPRRQDEFSFFSESTYSTPANRQAWLTKLYLKSYLSFDLSTEIFFIYGHIEGKFILHTFVLQDLFYLFFFDER